MQAIVGFVRALCSVSHDELANARSPRVFRWAGLLQ